MKQLLLTFSFLVLSIFSFTQSAHAVEDPLASPNNKIGIHILFPSELSEAAQLVNGNGGDWGYVVIPIQSGDRDLVKWQAFMDEAEEKHLIPILRLATEGDYFNTAAWRKPQPEDILDFANFLHSLEWPTKNRYVIVFNEVNRGDEWGGETDPADYAQLLSYSVSVFKSRSQDFFMIGGGFDNAAPNQGTQYINQYTYMQQMDAAIPGIFNQIDGYASHSYPNPAFSQPPSVNTRMSISSFSFERALLNQLTTKKLPIFITETGWSTDGVNDDLRAEYYIQAFSTAWSDPDIVTVTPFLLRASGPFAPFSFIKEDGSHTKQFTTIKNMTKVKGSPLLTKTVLGVQEQIPSPEIEKKFTPDQDEKTVSLSHALQFAFSWMMGL